MSRQHLAIVALHWNSRTKRDLGGRKGAPGSPRLRPRPPSQCALWWPLHRREGFFVMVSRHEAVCKRLKPLQAP